MKRRYNLQIGNRLFSVVFGTFSKLFAVSTRTMCNGFGAVPVKGVGIGIRTLKTKRYRFTTGIKF